MKRRRKSGPGHNRGREIEQAVSSGLEQWRAERPVRLRAMQELGWDNVAALMPFARELARARRRDSDSGRGEARVIGKWFERGMSGRLLHLIHVQLCLRLRGAR